MKTGSLYVQGADVKYSALQDENGNWMQFWYSILPGKPEPLVRQLETIESVEEALFADLSIPKESIALRRFFSSDLITHRDTILDFKQRKGVDFFLSMVEQPPATNVKLALLGMCLSNIKPEGRHRDGNVFVLETTSNIKHFFAEHLIDEEANERSDSANETTKIFGMLARELRKYDTNIEESVVRTWLYAPHVDADYAGIVKARKELFDAINMTEHTHYIASTGIQGGTGHRYAHVFMDAYAIIGVGKDKIHYIQALDHLRPTHEYGVTFERATSVEMGKTHFLFISGTASINPEGEVVHPGDVVKQTGRTLENVTALLKSASFEVADLSSMIVYLRDPSDYEFVKPVIEDFAGNLPSICVKAPVCRPGWLIEVEVTAAKNLG